MSVPTKKTIGLILLTGVVVFAAVFLGIRAADVIATNNSTLSPEDLSNQSSLKIGDPPPSLDIATLEGSPMTLADLSHEHPVVVAFVMPGCGPCGELMKDWDAVGFAEGARWKPVVVVAGDSSQARNSLPRAILQSYPVYTCDEGELANTTNITVSPTLLGLGSDGTVRFVVSGYTKQVGVDFFTRYLR